MVAWLQYVTGVTLQVVSPATKCRCACCRLHSCGSICAAVFAWEVDTFFSKIYTYAVPLQLKTALRAISWQAATTAQCMLAAW